MTPVYLTSTDAQDGPGEHKGFEYSRTHNPTRFALEDCIASLEGGNHGLCFTSGLAATDAVLHTLSTGDHVIGSDDLYVGTFRIFDKVWRRHGLDFDFVDPMVGREAFAAKIKPSTKMIWVETPTNPMLKLADIKEISALCKERLAPGRRQHLHDTVQPEPVRVGRRHHRALHHQVHKRPLRRNRRRSRYSQ